MKKIITICVCALIPIIAVSLFLVTIQAEAEKTHQAILVESTEYDYSFIPVSIPENDKHIANFFSNQPIIDISSVESDPVPEPSPIYNVVEVMETNNKIEHFEARPPENGGEEFEFFEIVENNPVSKHAKISQSDSIQTQFTETTNALNDVSTGGISGTVLISGTSTPIASAYVHAMDTNFDWIADDNTDSNGSYNITGLSTGNYYVAVSANGYGGVYYDNGYDDPSATLIHVEAPTITTNIDFNFAPEATITGTILEDGTGEPIGLADISVWPMNGGQIRNAYSLGDYSVGGLSTGWYVVKVQKSGYATEYYDDKNSWGEANFVYVEQPNSTPNIDFVLGPAGSITGTVTDATSDNPVEGMRVRVYEYDTGDYLNYDYSDVNGNYEISGLPTGDYRVKVSDWDGSLPIYADQYYSKTIYYDGAERVTVVAGNATTGIDFQLEAGGRVNGRVVAENGGAGLADMAIGVERASDHTWWYNCTNSNGDYSLEGFPVGDYKIWSRSDTRCESSTSYVEEFWQEKTNWDEADIVSFTSASPIQNNINVTLEEGGTISGRIVNETTGNPIQNLNVNVELTSYVGYRSTCTNSNGEFTIMGLGFGEYYVRSGRLWNYCLDQQADYVPEYYDDSPLLKGFTPVVISETNTEVSGINFSVEGGGYITGTVENESKEALQNVRIEARYQGPYSCDDCSYWFDHVYTDDTGEYVLGPLPEDVEFGIRARPSRSGYDLVDEYYDDVLNYSEATTFTITKGTYISGKNFELEQGGSISGYIYKADGSSVIDDVLISVHAHGVGDRTSSTGIYASQSDGSYTISGLAPGNYRVEANNNEELGYVTKFYYDKPSWNSADNVMVHAGSTTNGININLEHGGSITGKLFDTDGTTPLENACATVFIDTGTFDYVKTSDPTGSDGVYSLNNLVSGMYIVRSDVECNGDHENLWNMFYTEEGSVFNYRSASKINLADGATITGIDIQTEPAAHIEGVVKNHDGSTVIPYAGVGFYPADNPSSYWTYCADENGEFSIKAPYWELRVFATGNASCGSNPKLVKEFWEEELLFDDATVLILSESNQLITGITMTLEEGGVIQGTVYNEGKINPLYRMVVRTINTTNEDFSHFVCTNYDGNYSLEGIPFGDYKVYAAGSCSSGKYNYVLEYWEEKPNEEDANVISLSVSSHEFEDIDFTLLLGGGIEGHVLNANTIEPISDVDISIDAIGTTAGTFTRTITLFSDDGSYFINRLVPGSYKVMANSGKQLDFAFKYFNEQYTLASGDTVIVNSDENTVDIDFLLEEIVTAEITDEPVTLIFTSTEGTPVTIDVPSNAVDQITNLIYTPLEAPGQTAGFSFTGNSFSLKIYQDGDILEDFTFNNPINIKLEYDEANLSGISEEELILYYWDEVNELWVDAATTCDPTSVYIRNIDEDWISVPICHLTTFALMVPEREVYLPLLFNRKP